MVVLVEEDDDRRDRIVAVVGAGHIAGIKKFWEEPIDLRKICCLPVTHRSLVSSS